MYGKQLSNARYKRCLELFAAVHEEIGEAQKAFNDYAWNNSKKYGKIITELQQVLSPLLELIDTLKKAPICHSIQAEKGG